MSEELLKEATRAADDRDWSRAADILAGAVPSDFVVDRRAWYLSRAKRYDEALELLSELQRRRPDDFRPYYMIGYQYYDQGKYRESLSWFDSAIQRKPQHLKSLWRRAYALHKVGEEAKARVAAGAILRVWHELPPDQRDADRKILAKASYLLGKGQLRADPQGAVWLLRQAAENDPDDPYKHYLLGKGLRLSGQINEALLSLKRARKLKPGDVHIELEYAAALIHAGEVREGLRLIAQLSRRCRGWEAFKAGRLCVQARDRELAISLLRRARQDRPTRNDPKVREALEEALALPVPEKSQEAGDQVDRHTGRIELVRAKRGFGFLVDEEEGTKRHFRLKQGVRLDRGQQVSFIPMKIERGPAARDVRPA